jgi:pimeloyl-ACP methyl ester carboxylesterase
MFILKNIHKNKDGVYAWKLNFPILMEVFNKIMPSIKGDFHFNKESLVIRGGDSEYVSNENYKHIQEHFPKVNLKTIDGASHWLHADNPKEFIKIVENFIK